MAAAAQRPGDFVTGDPLIIAVSVEHINGSVKRIGMNACHIRSTRAMFKDLTCIPYAKQWDVSITQEDKDTDDWKNRWDNEDHDHALTYKDVRTQLTAFGQAASVVGPEFVREWDRLTARARIATGQLFVIAECAAEEWPKVMEFYRAHSKDATAFPASCYCVNSMQAMYESAGLNYKYYEYSRRRTPVTDAGHQILRFLTLREATKNGEIVGHDVDEDPPVSIVPKLKPKSKAVAKPEPKPRPDSPLVGVDGLFDILRKG